MSNCTNSDQILSNCVFVLFGATGDLARKKIFPAIYNLFHNELLNSNFTLVGFGRRNWNYNEFVAYVHNIIQNSPHLNYNESTWLKLKTALRFINGSFNDTDAFINLNNLLQNLTQTEINPKNYIFYLSIPPQNILEVCAQLKTVNLNQSNSQQHGKVVIEKPFGYDLHSYQSLNKFISETFSDSNIFRIDHYLAKETIQNIFPLRFANSIFEPLWNSNYIDHIQITLAEDMGLAGRATYYEGIGATRDIIQNHLLQILALIAMEKPKSFITKEIQKEKIKVLTNTKLIHPISETNIRGQYTSGWHNNQFVTGFTDEPGFNPLSITETYAAISVTVNTPRWRGVPFFLRTGKRLAKKISEIALVFKKTPNNMYSSVLENNCLILKIQPNPGIYLNINSKTPGTDLNISNSTMSFSNEHSPAIPTSDAYEKLILDVILNKPNLFITAKEIELSWKILDPLLLHWKQHGKPEPYPAGTWGPKNANSILLSTNRNWLDYN